MKHLALAASVWLAEMSSSAQMVVWSGHDATNGVNTNWSDAANWSGGTPGPATNLLFFDPGANATQGVVDNIVDGNTTILSLQYGHTNRFHTTQIGPGLTLTVSNPAAANLVFVGTGTDNGAGQSSYSTMAGAGAFTVVGTNAASAFVVQQGSASSGSHRATLDLSGLANFRLTAGRLVVGGANPGSPGSNNWLAGTLYLAGTNTIRVNGSAPAVDVGDAINNGATSYLYLGQTNAIFADSMTIARSKAACTLAFNPALTGSNLTLYLGGNSNARVSALAVGDFSPQATSSSTTSGTMDLTAGTVTAQVDTCYVGLGQTGSGAGTTTGTLRLGAGGFNVNTLNLGYASVNTAVGSVTGTLSLNNGTLVVNSNLLLGYNAGATATVTGTLNVTNGTVLANYVTAGGGTSRVNLSGGRLVVSNTLASPAAPLTYLSVNSGASLQFLVANHLTNAATSVLSSDNSGVINISALPTLLNYPSQFPLIACPAGGANGVRFALGALPGGYQGYVSNNTASGIWLVITNGPTLPKTDLWGGGVNGNWDTNTLNWTNNGVPVKYRELDLVVFDDSANTSAVILTGTAPHTPYSWTVSNNILNYTVAGTNSVGGPAGLVKSGGAALTLAESGDSFSGGITVNGGTIILDEAASAISGGLTIASGATARVGNNDAWGDLPAGPVVNNGALVFRQTIPKLVANPISGAGSLTQQGAGTLVLSATNDYTGDTVVLQGGLALTNGGSIAGSANVLVNNSTLDVSGADGPTVLGNLNMTNGVITVGPPGVMVAQLNQGGAGNPMNVAAMPPILFYPTNLTLIQSANGIRGYNFSLGSLPSAAPPYVGSLATNGNAVVLTLTAGPLAAVPATVSFSPTNAGLVLNPAFCGLSYEKSKLTGSLFVAGDTSLINMFGQIAPAVLRIGGNSVDTTCWGGLSNKTAITAAQVDALAGFVKALPTNWHVIYGINMSVNNPTNCAAEAAYVASALGSSLLGFEIGNEPDLYAGNGIRATSYTYSQFLSEWRALAAAITNTVPGWAVTNGSNGWTLTGPASASNTQGYTVPFAGNEQGVIAMVTQHYYRANGQSPTSTLQLLLQPDTALPGRVSSIVAAANAATLPLGFRMAECGSFYNGGAPNVSNGYGTALWALDFMFTLALNGCQGLNFHGGGNGTGYTPIADNGSAVVQARPEFYGLKMFSRLSQGNVIPATVTLASNLNFTAYGVRRASGGISALLNNKDTNNYVQVTLNLGATVTAAQMLALTGPALDSTNGYTLGGAVINADGSWAGGVQWVIPATNGQVTVIVPPITAVLLDPVVLPGSVNLTWKGDGAANRWDVQTATNWLNAGAPAVFHQGDAAAFTDAGSNTPAINLTTSLAPVNVTVNATHNYTFGGSGQLTGAMNLNKSGSGTLFIQTTNSYVGGTTINAGTLQLGSGIVSGTLPGDVADYGTLTFVVPTNTTQAYAGSIGGSGAVTENGFGGTLVLAGTNTFTGNLTVTAGALWINASNAPGTGTKTIFLSNGTAGHPELHLNGVNGNLRLPATVSFTTSWIGGGGSQGVLINEAGDNEIDGNFSLTSGGGGTAIVVNGGTLKLAGNLSPITSLRSVQLGGAGNGTVTGAITDNGANLLTAVNVVGPGIWTLAGTNTYVTNTTVSGGTLLVNGAVGSGGLTVQANATIGGAGSVGGATTVQSGGILQGGDVNYSNTLTVAMLNLGNTSNATTYSRFTVAAGGRVAATTLNVSGTNVVQILDPSLTVGTNTLFTYTGAIGGSNGFGSLQLGTLPAGVTAQLLNTGSAVELAVTAVSNIATNPTNLTFSVSGNVLNLSWPADHLGWMVQSNSVDLSVPANWYDLSNTASGTNYGILLDATRTNVFYRLRKP